MSLMQNCIFSCTAYSLLIYHVFFYTCGLYTSHMVLYKKVQSSKRALSGLVSSEKEETFVILREQHEPRLRHGNVLSSVNDSKEYCRINTFEKLNWDQIYHSSLSANIYVLFYTRQFQVLGTQQGTKPRALISLNLIF